MESKTINRMHELATELLRLASVNNEEVGLVLSLTTDVPDNPSKFRNNISVIGSGEWLNKAIDNTTEKLLQVLTR
jgi:hypothetical protein